MRNHGGGFIVKKVYRKLLIIGHCGGDHIILGKYALENNYDLYIFDVY